MECSSPLAAMQAQTLPFGNWGFRLNVPTSNPHCRVSAHVGAGNFNFRDLSMNGPPIDYFNMKPVRGSSPTSSLAADLSQNFHIDRSPQLPTPRRSLFSSHFLGAHTGRENTLTPPLPSSSPGPGSDSMDISPLPHKIPFVRARIQIQSPTPELTPTTDSMDSTPCQGPQSPSDSVKPTAPIERKRPAMLRRTLSRTKGYTTTAVSIRSAGIDNQLPAFKFGNGPLSASGPLMSLEECFVESPQQTAFSNSSTTAMGPPKSRLAFSNLGTNARSSNSPLTGHIRKPSGPTQRPRKQFRRSLSMFEHPAEVMKQQKPDELEGKLQSIMDIDDIPNLQLPHFVPEQDVMPRITKETMVDILDGKYNQCYEKSLIIDCRFEYEYKGGHIDGAINFNNKEELASKLFQQSSAHKTLLIFHCEYSAHRAPIAARFIRHEDRATNAHQYPKLTFPEVYILDGGYSSFFKDYQIRCFPQNYVEMNDKEHSNACERGLGRMKQQRGKLSRAQTFAFGQHSQSTEDSPTAVNRQCSELMMGMDLSITQQFDLQRNRARRMASY